MDNPMNANLGLTIWLILANEHFQIDYKKNIKYIWTLRYDLSRCRENDDHSVRSLTQSVLTQSTTEALWKETQQS
jgi:hypothetical protein